MANLETVTGRFVVEDGGNGHIRATLHNATRQSGDRVALILVIFPDDISELLQKGWVPSLFGTPIIADHDAMLRGVISKEDEQAASVVMSSVVFLEMVADFSDCLVTYAFRLDGAGYELLGCVDDLPAKVDSSTTSNGTILVHCQFQYLPATRRMTITLIDSKTEIQVPNQIVDLLLDRLRLDTIAGPDGSNVLAMSGTGVIDGQLFPNHGDRDGAVVVPTVITFQCGVAVHRLWLNRTSFRWLIEEPLVVPIP